VTRMRRVSGKGRIAFRVGIALGAGSPCRGLRCRVLDGNGRHGAVVADTLDVVCYAPGPWWRSFSGLEPLK